MQKQQLDEELGNIDVKLMEVRKKLRDVLKARAKLASLEFDSSSASIIREKDTIQGRNYTSVSIFFLFVLVGKMILPPSGNSHLKMCNFDLTYFDNIFLLIYKDK